MSEELEAKLDQHEQILPLRRLIPVLASLSLCCILNMTDSTSVSIASPYIAADLHAEKTIQWAGTAMLMSNAIFTVWTGRLSDIFGRKNVLLFSGIVIAISDLGAGFVTKDYQFFILRGLAGIGSGALNSIPIITLSDVVTFEKRGLYQGILGSFISIGLALGPFVISGFIEGTVKGWRSFYWFMSPSLLLVTLLCYWILPNSSSKLSRMEIMKNFDYLGSLLIAASFIFILIPINGGGNLYNWNSPLVIVMFSFGGALLIIFIIVEWKFAKLPMVPLRLFKNSAVSNIMGSAFLYGIVYSSILYYMPYYVELIRGFSVIKSCAYLAITNLTTAAFSTITGRLVNYLGGYNYVIWIGYLLWTLVNGLFFTIGVNTSMKNFAVFLMFLGISIGCTFQPTILALQANASKRDRALVLAVRNVLRALGNSIGVALSSLIYTNTLIKNVNSNTQLNESIKQQIVNNAYTKPDLKVLSNDQVILLKILLMKSMKNLFIFWVPLIAICLIASFFIKDGLQFDANGDKTDVKTVEIVCVDELDKEKEKSEV